MSERVRRRIREQSDSTAEPDPSDAPDLAVISPLAAFLDDAESALSELREYARVVESRERRRRS